MHSHINFAYPAYVTYGHLAITALALPISILAFRRNWSRWIGAVISLVALWSVAAFLIMRFVININGPATLPTQAFLASPNAPANPKILDMGAGSGRSAIMTLEARPTATLTALDLFADQYDRHFDNPDKTPDIPSLGHSRLLANFRAAGVDDRATITTGDMRKMPLETAAFDGIVSAYAIDHLSTKGIEQALSEANRVLKPKGEFLLMVIAKDNWMRFVGGPVAMHTGTRSAARWTELFTAAGFDVVEQGTQPLTIYLLARKR